MTPGPTIIRKCSSCAKLIAQSTIASGNTFGARFWTDAKMEAPMLPDQPRLVKCRHCSALVWIDEQEQIGEIDPWRARKHSFPDALPYSIPTTADYEAILSRNQHDPAKHRYLRLRVWWAGNDARRSAAEPTILTDIESANIRRLAELLDETKEQDRLMKAEAMRELGEYELALQLLDPPFSSELATASARIRSLATQRNAMVARIEMA